MKRYVGIMLAVIMVCAGCSKSEKPVKVDPSKLGYYNDSYGRNRALFLEEAASLKKKYSGVEISKIAVKSPAASGLTIDSCYIPAQKEKKRLLIVSSGVHGIEGLGMSAVQRMVMKEILPGTDLGGTGVLFIHAVNPYGQELSRRVTESNVDLNRNFDVDKKIFALKNPGYAVVNGLLNPAEKLNVSSPGYLFFPVKAIYYIIKHGMGTLRAAILKGQYEFPKGVYYGGKDFEPQKADIEKLILKAGGGYKNVFVLDLHTGYGERNRLHFFPNPITDKKNLAATREVFKGYQIDWGDGGDFYITTGDFTDYIEKLFPGKTVIRMTAEFGTMDSQTTLGSIKSLQITIMENQAFQYGGKTPDDIREIKKRFREMYYPSSDEWRSEVMRQSAEVFPVLIKRYAELK